MTSNSRVTEADKVMAERIRTLRQNSGAFVTVVAGHLGITYQSYQKIEAGKTAIRAIWLSTLAEIFGVPVTHFYEDNQVDHGDAANAPSVLAFAKNMRGIDPILAQRACQAAISMVKNDGH